MRAWIEADSPEWYVLQTKPRDEARVIQHLALRASHIETFFPKIEIRCRRAGRLRALLEPLFPNYLFTRFQMNPHVWNAVRWTPGVQRVLGDDKGPLPVAAGLIEAIQERVETLGFVRIGLGFARGDRVRVKSGPFMGLEGIFERPTTRRDRVRVLLEILGAPTPLELEVFELERA